MVPSDGDEKVAPHREVQEEEDPTGKESANKKKGRRRSGRSSPGILGPPERRTGKRKSHQKASNSGGGEDPQAKVAEVAPGDIPTGSTGRLNRKARAPTARDLSTERSDSPGQGETGPGKPPVSERFQPDGRRLLLAQGPSAKGSESVHRRVRFGVGRATEGSDNRRTSPRRRPAVHTPHGQATQPSPPQAEPATASDEG